jgi:peptide/nickel transport system permease protein
VKAPEWLSGRGKQFAQSFLYNAGLVAFLLVLVFLLFSALPADPARLMLGTNASQEAVASLRKELGLNQPLSARFVQYLENVVTLNFGNSYVTRRPVAPDLFSAFKATLTYVGSALLISVVYSLLSTCLAYFGGKWPRRVIRGINSFFTSIPSLVVAIALGVLFLSTNALAFVEPVGLRNVLTAAIVLSVYPGCTLSQILIEESLEVRQAQYVTMGRSLGYSETRIFLSYVLRNAILPWLAQFSNVAASMVAGSIVVEVVFSLPGLGRLVIQSVLRSDFPMMQGIVLVTSISFLVIDFVMERVYHYLFPLEDAG